jgi:hypothetical protein
VLNADVISTAGAISLRAGTSLTANSNADVATQGASIDMTTLAGDLSLSDTSFIQTNNKDILLTAAGNLIVGGIDAGLGNVVLIAAGSILDGGDSLLDILADGIALTAGTGIGLLGATVNALDVDARVLTASTNTGGISLNERNSLIIGSVGARITAVQADASAVGVVIAATSDLATLTQGSLVLVTNNGSLTLTDGDADGLAVSVATAGNLLMVTNGVGANLQINSDILVASGSVSLQAANSIVLGSNADVVNAGGSVELQALAGAISMADSSLITSATDGVRLLAAESITLGSIDAGTATISLTALAGSILDGGDTRLDLVAGALRLNAANGIGELGDASNALEISTLLLSALSGNGGISLLNQGSLTVTRVANTVKQVLADGSQVDLSDVAQADVIAQASGISLRTVNGDITLNDGDSNNSVVTNMGTGNILIEALAVSGQVNVNADIATATGSISIAAPSGIQLAAGTDVVTASGDIDLLAGAGAISLSDTANVVSDTGSIRLLARNDISVGGISAIAGSISVQSLAGSLLDSGDAALDLVALNARIDVAGQVGTVTNPLETSLGTIAVRTGTGISLIETDSLIVDSVATSVRRVAANGTTSLVSDTAIADLTVSIAGSLLLQTTAGSLTLNDGDANGLVINLAGAGNVLMVAGSTDTDINVNAGITLTRGSASLIASRNIDLAVNSYVDLADGSLQISAVAGSLTMAASARLQTVAGNIALVANTNLTLGLLDTRTVADRAGASLANQAGWGRVSLSAAIGSITDSASADQAVDIYAAELRLNAGQYIGTLTPLTVNPLETEVMLIAAVDRGLGLYGGVNVIDATAITVGRITPVSVKAVQVDGSLVVTADTADQSDLVTTTNGTIVLRSVNGSITINDGDTNGRGIVAAGTGAALVEAQGVGSSILINSDINAVTGAISILAANSVTQAANADLLTSGASIEVIATTGTISMSDESLTTTGAGIGNIRYQALADISVGGINAGIGHVSIEATSGSILDAGDTYRDIASSGLRLLAGIAVGNFTNPLETNVTTLTANAGSGGVSINEADDLRIDRVTVNITRVLATGELLPLADIAQVDVLINNGGDLLVRTLDGTLTVNDGDTNGLGIQLLGSGSMILQAVGTDSDIILNTDLLTQAGGARLVANDSIVLASGADLLTLGGVIDVEAIDGSILLADASLVDSGGQTIRLSAAADIQLGGVNAGAGSVGLLATLGSILDAGDTYSDIIADGTRIIAGNNIGGIGSINVDALDVALGTITVLAETGGIGLVETDDILVGSVSVSLARRDDVGNLMTITDATQSDLTTGTNGSIILISKTGTITVTDGADVNGQGIAAGGTGNVLLQADVVDVVIDSGVVTNTGNVSVIAGNDVVQTLTGDVTTNGGTLNVDANNNVVMADGAVSITNGGDISVSAGDSVTLGSLNAGAGSVLVKTATGDVLDGGDQDVDVIAKGLAIDAGANIGVVGVSVSNAIDTRVEALAASSDTGYVNILEADDVTIDTVTVTVQQIADDATSTSKSSSQSDLITDAGALILMTVDGSINVNAGLPAITRPAETQPNALILPTESLSGVSSRSGNVLLAAQGTDRNLVLNSDVITLTGNITLVASGNVQQAAETKVESETGTLFVEAIAGAVQMADSSQIRITSGDILIGAGTDIMVANIAAETGSISLTSQTVSDAGDTDVDISAAGILMKTSGDIGGAASGGIDELEINAGVLTASSVSGNVFLQDVNELIIGAVSVVVQRAQADGTLVVVSQSQTGLTTGGAGQIQLVTAGTLQMEAETAITTDAGAVVLTIGGDANISSIRSNTGSVAIIVSGAILDRLAAVVDGVEVDNIVTGGDLTLTAVSGIGTQADDLNVSVRSLTASNGLVGSINATASSDLIVNTVSNESAEPITITVMQGNLTVQGRVVSSGEGSIALTAANTILQTGLISAASGDVAITAIEGGVTMQGDARTESGGENIVITANGDVLLTVVFSQVGTIQIVSNEGSILDNLVGDGDNVITGGIVLLSAAKSIGSADGEPLYVDASFDSIRGFTAETISIKFANGRELNGSYQSFYAIATKRDFEPSLTARAVLTPMADLFAGEFEKRAVLRDAETLLRLFGEFSEEDLLWLLRIAGSALADDARLLFDMLRILAGNYGSSADDFNLSQAEALAAVERQLVLLRAETEEGAAVGEGEGNEGAAVGEGEGNEGVETKAPAGRAERDAATNRETAPAERQSVMG